MGDGLVAMRNETVEGSPRAFVHRAHSGRFGILNAESGYQNLVRFLFGDVRVDGVLKVNGLTLPPAVYRKWEKNPDKRLRASYHFETVVRVRGARWDLHRRVAAEASAVFRKYEELQGADEALRHPHLFSTFLSASGWAKANARRPYLGFSIELRIRVPEFVLDGAFLLDDHHEGSNIFSDTILVDVAPPKGRAGRWRVRYGFDSSTPGRATRPLEVVPFEGGARLAIPVRQPNHPSIDAVLELTARPWNRS